MLFIMLDSLFKRRKKRIYALIVKMKNKAKQSSLDKRERKSRFIVILSHFQSLFSIQNSPHANLKNIVIVQTIPINLLIIQSKIKTNPMLYLSPCFSFVKAMRTHINTTHDFENILKF